LGLNFFLNYFSPLKGRELGKENLISFLRGRKEGRKEGEPYLKRGKALGWPFPVLIFLTFIPLVGPPFLVIPFWGVRFFNPFCIFSTVEFGGFWETPFPFFRAGFSNFSFWELISQISRGFFFVLWALSFPFLWVC